MSDIPSDRLREDAEGVSSFRTFEPEDVGFSFLWDNLLPYCIENGAIFDKTMLRAKTLWKLTQLMNFQVPFLPLASLAESRPVIILMLPRERTGFSRGDWPGYLWVAWSTQETNNNVHIFGLVNIVLHVYADMLWYNHAILRRPEVSEYFVPFPHLSPGQLLF